jgi:hypothetical protein
MHNLKPGRLGLLLLILNLWPCLAVNADAENCQLQLNETTLDYGNVTRASMLGNPGSAAGLSLGSRQITLNVLCQKSTAFALMVKGPGGLERFKFGDNGQFTMRLSGALLDGQPVNLGLSQAGSKIVTESSASVSGTPGSMVVPVVAGQSAKGKSLSLQARIDTAVSEAATRVRDRTTWQGNVTFEVLER